MNQSTTTRLKRIIDDANDRIFTSRKDGGMSIEAIQFEQLFDVLMLILTRIDELERRIDEK